MPDPERSQRSKAVWAKASPETRERWRAGAPPPSARPRRGRPSRSAPKRFCASEEVRAAMRARSSSRPSAMRRPGAPRSSSAGSPRAAHWTPEQHQAAQLKRDAFFAKRRASVLSALSGEGTRKKERD